MKSIIILYLFTYVTYNLNGQNLVRNYSFESLKLSKSYFVCPDPSPSKDPDNCQPFFRNRVFDWENLCETPEINALEYYTGEYCAKMVANVNSIQQPTLVEGIFQNTTFLPNKIYTLSLKYKSINYGVCNIYLANSLDPKNPNNILPYKLTPNNSYNVGNTSSNSFNATWQTISFNFTTGSIIYNQIGFSSEFKGTTYPNSGTVLIDDVIITESCCSPSITFSNIINPPSKKAEDYINLGPNVNFIDNSSTYFTAKNEILLANNTSIDGVSAFIAQAEDCLNQPIEFYQQIEEIQVNSNCYFRILLSACFGSGQYAFYFGEELSTDKYKDYSLENAGSTITVKVIDLITGVIVVKDLVIPNKPIYLEKITMTIPNVFTPNGDGINDIFRITDNNKSQFAYNATWFYLQIWNRWGNDILIQERVLNAGNFYGFSDDEIYWNGRNNNDIDENILEPGTYYYLFRIGNCNPNELKTIRGTITLIKNNYKEEVGIDFETSSYVNFPSEIYPNPTANNVSLKLFNVNKTTQITITDILGKQLNIDCKLVENKNGIQEYSIDCSLLNNGIYFCSFNKNGVNENIKFSVLKQ